MKTNYVIATYNGKCKRNHIAPAPEYVLQAHLYQFVKYDHNLSQITIMKPTSENYYKGYYDLDTIISLIDIPVKIVECENYGYSCGQYLKAYELFPDFDQYIFVEDDYCPNMDNFDQILQNIYKTKFNNNIGVLCSLVQGSSRYKEEKTYPIHWEGAIYINKQTLEKLYKADKWNNDPRSWMDKIDSTIDNEYNWEYIKKKYIGGYYQLTFSHLFTLIGIEHKQYLQDNNLQFPYWDDSKKNKIGGKIIFFNQNNTEKNQYNYDDIVNSPFVPIQLASNKYISINTNIKLFTPKSQYPYRIPIDISSIIKLYSKNKIVCDLGCAEGDILEYLIINNSCKEVKGIEYDKKRIVAEREYIKYGNVYEKIPTADIYLLWLGQHFNYKKIINKIPYNSIIVYMDGSEKNHELFQLQTNLKLIKNYIYKYNEAKFIEIEKLKDNLINLKKLQKINPNWQLKGERICKVYFKPKPMKIIFVIGMHRCGTSLLTSCLVKNGLSIGKDINKDIDVQNPKGYFENDAFTVFHEKLLKTNNASWKTISKQCSFTKQDVIQYRFLLIDQFSEGGNIVIKDPRLTFMINFIKEVCLDIYPYTFIFCTRNIQECCTSLSKAQKIEYSVAETLYKNTHKQLSEEMLLINHQDLLFNNNNTIKHIFNKLTITQTENTNDLVDISLYRNKVIKSNILN